MHAPPTSVQWVCSAPLLSDYRPATNDGPDAGEGVTYLYVGGKPMRRDYAADALFLAPLDGRRGWYESGIVLRPLHENNMLVQIGISRWQRFNYRPHVAIAWALPGTTVVHYKDTGIMLDGTKLHRLGISVQDGTLRLLADGRVVCSTGAAQFVTPAEGKYFQVRTETSVVGRNGNARVWGLRFKRDSDRRLTIFRTDCILHRKGIYWYALGAGAFAARGAFYPSEATYFTGVDPNAPCRLESR